MSRVVKRSATEAIKTSVPVARGAPSNLPQWTPPQLCQLVEFAPSGPQWVHEIKLDGFRMAARIERGRAQLLTRTGLDWTDKYPAVVAALSNLPVKAAYLDGELCGIGEDGLPSFSQTQAASDGSRGVQLVYYVFDLLHLDARDTAGLPLIERKALLEPLVTGVPGLQFNGHLTGDGELIREHAGRLGHEGVVSKTIRRALCARQPGALAEVEMPEPSGICRGRLDRPRGIEATSRRASAGLLHRRRQADLRWPGRHGHAGQDARRLASPARTFGEIDHAAQRAASAQDTVRVTSRIVARSLGRAAARRRNHLSDLDRRRIAAPHCLRRASVRQAGKSGAKRSLKRR